MTPTERAANDRIEFYAAGKMIASVSSSMVPEIGRFINIRRQTWKVKSVTYALDNIDAKFDRPRMRANVDLIRRKDMDP